MDINKYSALGLILFPLAAHGSHKSGRQGKVAELQRLIWDSAKSVREWPNESVSIELKTIQEHMNECLSNGGVSERSVASLKKNAAVFKSPDAKTQVMQRQVFRGAIRAINNKVVRYYITQSEPYPLFLVLTFDRSKPGCYRVFYIRHPRAVQAAFALFKTRISRSNRSGPANSAKIRNVIADAILKDEDASDGEQKIAYMLSGKGGYSLSMPADDENRFSSPNSVKQVNTAPIQQGSPPTTYGLVLECVTGTRSQSLDAAVTGAWGLIGKSMEEVGCALVGQRIITSPFNIDGLLRLAKRSLFVSGQNLWWLAKNRRSEVLDWLKGGDKRWARLLICRLRKNPFITGWEYVGQSVIPDLKESRGFFREWQSEAQKRNLDLCVFETMALTLNVSIIDEEEEDSCMVLTPVVPFENLAAQRPHFVVSKRDHTAIYSYYYLRYRDLLTRATQVK